MDATLKLWTVIVTVGALNYLLRPLEIDALLTAVREIAMHVAIPTPHIDALLGLTRLFARTRGLYPR